MLTFLAPIWNNPVTRKIAAILGAALLLFIAYEGWKAGIVNSVRRQEKAAREKDDLKEQAKVIATQQSIERTLNDHSAKADLARADLPVFVDAAELRHARPDLAEDILPVSAGNR